VVNRKIIRQNEEIPVLFLVTTSIYLTLKISIIPNLIDRIILNGAGGETISDVGIEDTLEALN